MRSPTLALCPLHTSGKLKVLTDYLNGITVLEGPAVLHKLTAKITVNGFLSVGGHQDFAIPCGELMTLWPF